VSTRKDAGDAMLSVASPSPSPGETRENEVQRYRAVETSSQHQVLATLKSSAEAMRWKQQYEQDIVERAEGREAGLLKGTMPSSVMHEVLLQSERNVAIQRRQAAAESLKNPQLDYLRFMCDHPQASTSNNLRMGGQLSEHSQRMAAINEALYVSKTGSCSSPLGTTPVVTMTSSKTALRGLSEGRKAELLAQMPTTYLTSALQRMK